MQSHSRVAVKTPAEQEAMRVAGRLAADVLVTYHLMPGMTGADFARTVRGRWPEIRILLISGYSEEDGVAPDLLCLTKPFRRDELAEALARH
jgi:CheY-like chemotaxis protein